MPEEMTRGTGIEEELRIAVAEGLVPRDQTAHLEEEARRRGRSPLELLCDDGRISAETLALLRAGAGVTLAPAAPSPPPAPTPTDPAAAFPLPGWDRYEPIRLLGQGGMGRVFLARDVRLRREVALKFVRGDDPELARRFVAEARAQARVSDERVCKVYEVGEVDGRIYIVMQYIDGRTLGDLCGELTVEQKAMLVRGAALGVNEAHRAGLIHRDIKPSNVIVERTADGELRPYVMDFGLARDWNEGTTVTGTVLGTPHYMAPEQARGEVARLDRRADVYSLGATLYALLAGQAPIPGGNPLQVLANVASVEPRPLRAIDRDIPADLEAIVMKCLEKDRSARYDSARALADDLGRFLAGEPVLARATGLGYRLLKWLRKNARLAAGVAVALSIVLIALGYAALQRRQVLRREELARRFTERMERIESLARYSALSPPHDARADRAKIRAQMDTLESEIRAAGAIAEGPGRYALGYGHLALGDDDRALEELTAAWQGGFREPRVAYALALATGHLYQRALLELERLPSAEQRDERRGELERRYRDPTLRYLRESRGADVPSRDYLAALVAFYEGRYDDALHSLDAIGDVGAGGLVWFYEVPLLRGQILQARAAAERWKGDSVRAASDYDEGRRAFAAAAAIGESDPAVHEALGELEYSALAGELYGRGDVDPPFDRGIEAAGRALAILPDHSEALVLRAQLRRSLAEYRGSRGQDVTDLLTRATADAQRAVELAPARAEAKLELARIWRQWGEFRQSRSQDPGEQLGKAVEISSSIPPAERGYEFYAHLGLCFMIWADYQDKVGEDSQQNRSGAIDAYGNAIRINERASGVWLNLGINYYKRAELPRHPDFDGDIGRAIAAFERGRALVPKHIVPYFYEGKIHVLKARHSLAAGRDPGPDLALALASYRAGLAVNAKVPQLYSGIGTALLEQARSAWDHGADPFPLLDQARASFDQAGAVAPSFGLAYSNIGEVLRERARFERARGGDPSPSAREAVAAFRKALARIPDAATTWASLAMAYTFLAAHELDRGRDPTANLAEAQAALKRALATSPKVKQVLLADGETKGLQARLRARTGQGREEDFDAAAKSFSGAVDLAPEDLTVRVQYGTFCLAWASWLKDAKKDPMPALRRGLDQAEQVLRMCPACPDALALRASLLLWQAEDALDAEERRELAGRAAEDFRRALSANPNLAVWRGRTRIAEQRAAAGP